MLSDLPLNPVYDSAECDIVHDLQVPLLSKSSSYLRGVGFFTSGWMRVAAHGLQALVENGGKARIVLSPILDRDDWNAIVTGQEAAQDEALYHSLTRSVQDIAHELERNTRNTLAWLVADDLVEFRFAVERNSTDGDYHDKVGVFEDASGNVVAIHGSFNDSIKATLNGEAFSVFCSWIPGQQPFVKQHKARLEQLWAGNNAQFKTLLLPDAVKEQIVKLRDTTEPPYVAKGIARTEPAIEHERLTSSAQELRDYQSAAIEAWKAADYQGMFDMATGTGKTITSLAAANKVVDELGVNLIVILVPYLHLMEQWGKDARKFGFNPVLCSGEDADWPLKLRSALGDVALGGSRPTCVIAVHNTGATDRFRRLFKRVRSNKTLLIADEVHGLGAANMRDALLPVAGRRLGLSATPRRWFDEEGNSVLEAYFRGVCFEMPLEAAIGKVLTPYSYHPQLIEFEPDELSEYQELSRQIGLLVSRDGFTLDERLKILLLRRSRLIAGAAQKLPVLIKLLSDIKDREKQAGREIQGVLVYAPAGRHVEYLQALANMGIRCHEFVHRVSLKKREEVLRQFAIGHIQALVAIRCLDEGVDVPSTNTAFILASSTNPREFVQRRGRILRRAPGKKQAVIYDFMVMPGLNSGQSCDDSSKSLLRREMPRFAEFASAALNEFEARSLVRPLLDRCEMLPLLDKKPWDVYKETKQREWELENAE